jgi:hypothetical protein
MTGPLWFLSSPWCLLTLWLPLLAFLLPVGSGPKEHRP